MTLDALVESGMKRPLVRNGQRQKQAISGGAMAWRIRMEAGSGIDTTFFPSYHGKRFSMRKIIRMHLTHIFQWYRIYALDTRRSDEYHRLNNGTTAGIILKRRYNGMAVS